MSKERTARLETIAAMYTREDAMDYVEAVANVYLKTDRGQRGNAQFGFRGVLMWVFDGSAVVRFARSDLLL